MNEEIKNHMKNRIKSRVMAHINDLPKTEFPFKSLLKVQMKERILDSLPELQKNSGFSGVLRFSSSMTLSLFLAVLFLPVFGTGDAFVRAAVDNYVSREFGDVYLNGNLLAQNTMPLSEGDVLTTGEGGRANIFFYDDSRLTMDASSELEIVNFEPRLEVKHESGRVWVQVLNMFASNSHFVLHAKNDLVVDVDYRASFTSYISEDLTKIAVARNMLEFSLGSERGSELSKARSLGQGLEYDAQVDAISSVSEELTNETWWLDNLAYGRNYASNLSLEYNEMLADRVNLLPGDWLYPVKTLKEALHAGLTFDAESKKTLILEHAYNRLDEASVLLEQGNSVEAFEVLDEYKNAIADAGFDDAVLEAPLTERQQQFLFKDPTFSGAFISSSQKLNLIPELLVEGESEAALEYLREYEKDFDLDAFENFDDVLKDLEKLRFISHMSNIPLEDVTVQDLAENLAEKSMQYLAEIYPAQGLELKDQLSASEPVEQVKPVEPVISAEIPLADADVDLLPEDERFQDLNDADKSHSQ